MVSVASTEVSMTIADEGAVEEGFDAEIFVRVGCHDGGAEVLVGRAD
jgi:sugar (pentulose or hexulose) kinase